MGSLDQPATLPVPGTWRLPSPGHPWLRRQMAPDCTPEAPGNAGTPHPRPRRGGGGGTSRPAWKWHPPFPKLAGAPHPQLNQMLRRQWRWGQTGVSVPKRGRKEWGGAVVSPPWAAWWPRPDCPAEEGAAGSGVRQGLSGCPLTLAHHLRSHVLPSDQSAPVRQQLLPDPAQ